MSYAVKLKNLLFGNDPKLTKDLPKLAEHVSQAAMDSFDWVAKETIITSLEDAAKC
jgi:hypothetical protein